MSDNESAEKIASMLTGLDAIKADTARLVAQGHPDWSSQQQAFLDFCEDPNGGSAVLIAVAGAGKTTVLLEGGKRIAGGVAYVAYNKKIVEETDKKLAKMGIHWQKMRAGTAHSYGWGAYRKAQPGACLAEQKVAKILDAMIVDLTDHPLEVHKPKMRKLISLAKQSMFGVLRPIESVEAWLEMIQHYDIFDEDDGADVPLDDVIRYCQDALRMSNSDLLAIDFDDMIYMPLLKKVRFWRHDVVMVDEAQDTNAARRALVRAMLRPGGRLIAVGDPHQAIYGFTGADSDSLDLIQRDFSCRRMNLTITYRCPKEVVRFSQRWVSHIQAAETAPEGEVSRSTMEAFLLRNDLTSGSAVLCRNTKPLVSLAFAMIRIRKPCRIEGRDVGKSLQRLMTKWKVTSLDALTSRIDAYMERERTKLLAKKMEAKLQQVEDMVDTVRVIIDQCLEEKKRNVSDAVDYVDQLFGDDVSDVMVLSTIHKSKGREWETVFWLDRAGTCPSKYARQDWQMEQEKNLMYVAATRSMGKLIELAPAEKKERK